MEENTELKTEVDALENEITETQDRFTEQDAKELKRMRSEMAALARTCRTFHLKLKRAERKSGKLKAQNEELSQEVEAVRAASSSRTGVAAEASNRTEMWTSAA